MKITIDTKEDSPTDIRKVIALLSKLLEDSPEKHSSIFDSPSEDSSGANAFANMFGSNDSIDKTPVLGESIIKKKKEEEEAPRIIEY